MDKFRCNQSFVVLPQSLNVLYIIQNFHTGRHIVYDAAWWFEREMWITNI